jgi:EAL domain-containing protein (putative c-di-GMP-specific phosphodiesterase class I)
MNASLIDTIQKSFTAYYQPIVDLNTDRVAGFEALTRMRGADGSISTPGAVIEEIEKDIDALTALIRELLCAVARDIVPLFTRYPDFYVSINIPPVVLGTGRIKTIIDELQLMPHIRRLVVEVTERQVLTEIGRTALAQTHAYGIRIAIDDFGTGHSGIEQIAGLDLDILKIDHSLVKPVLTSRTSARMLRGIVALASALRMRTIAEGVETWEQAFFMRAAGVDYGQGWFWSKALPAGEIERALTTGFSKTGRLESR